MSKISDRMIEHLVDDLRPVRPLQQRTGMAQLALSLTLGAAVVAIGFGMRADIMAGQPDPMFLTAIGLFLVLAFASGWSAIDMARPYVGSQRDGWIWTALMAAVLPVAALALMALDLAKGHAAHVDSWGIDCLSIGGGMGLLTLGVLTLWLRRGAPTSPAKAGMLAGVASGAAGIVAVSLCCPANGLIHIGLWHGGTVILMGLLGRLILPRFLAW